MSFDYDVAIVGGGPIGSTLAYELAMEKLNVCIIDKKKQVGLPLQCAGIVNKRLNDINKIPQDLILNKARGANIHGKNHSLKVAKDETQAFIIDRVAYDQYLFKRASTSGVDTFLSSKVYDIDSKEGLINFSSAGLKKQIKSKIIVGADGPKSLMSSKIGNEFKYYNASQYLVEVDKIDEMDFVDLYPSAELFPGFLWVIPVYKNIFRIGLFSIYDYKKQGEILDNFLEDEFKYDDFEVLEKYKGKIPIYDNDKKLFKDRVILIGDAASQVKPTTGGGLLLGSESVLIAKENIINALNEDDTSLLSNYQNDFYKEYSSEFSYQIKVQKTLSTLSDDDLDYLFDKLKEKEVDKLISEYGDMDNQSILVKELIKRGLILSLLPAIHKRELAKIWLLD